MISTMPQHTLLMTVRHALVVMLICYTPHFATAPWWLAILILTAIGYRLIADYFGYPLLNLWIRAGLVIACLFLLKIHYGSIVSSGFFIGFLLTFIGLKIIEIHSVRDLKVLVLCNFYLIFSALIIIQELWIIVYLLITILANLSLMLKLSAPQASLKQIGGKSIKQLLIAIPLSIILFYVFPRIADPLWNVPAPAQGHTGFSEKMNPGSIADLFNDDSTALRITFKNKPILNGYWRGLILSFYNGVSWNHTAYTSSNFPPLEELNTDNTADYEIILEPHQKKWLFYLGYPIASRPLLLFSLNYGLISQNKEIINQRFAYSLQVVPTPYHALNQKELLQNTQLPKNLNPRIYTWAKEQFVNLHQDPKEFITFLSNYIKQQPFWYTLTPPRLSSNKNQMDQFWFDTQKGYCEHYASAITIILRSVGIPARVVVGYQGGEWNPIAQYITIKQSDAHAWLEYWQEGIGWQQLDPTSFIASERIDQSIRDAQANSLEETNYSGMSWLTRTRLFLDSARFFAERWLLFYNQDTQQDLLQRVGLGQWTMRQLLQSAVASFILFMILIGFFYQWWQKQTLDPLLIEYHLLQKEFRRFNVSTHPSATLNQQCKALVAKAPNLAPTIASFLFHYEKLRLQRWIPRPKENKKRTVLLFKSLRRKLSQNKPCKVSTN